MARLSMYRGANRNRLPLAQRTFPVLVSFLAAAALPAANWKIARDLQSLPADSRVDVIVKYTSQPASRHHQRVQKLGGLLQSELQIIRSGMYRVTPDMIEILAADPDVLWIAPDREVHGMLDYTGPTVGARGCPEVRRK